MPNELAPARLRELIAAATPGPWWGQYEYDGGRTVCQMRSTDTLLCVNMATHVCGKPYRNTKANAELITALVNNAPALADALAKVQIYEEALIAIDRGRGGCEETHCWNVAEQALIRAAKESADAK